MFGNENTLINYLINLRIKESLKIERPFFCVNIHYTGSLKPDYFCIVFDEYFILLFCSLICFGHAFVEKIH